ncbi:MAG: transporter [Solirubrobacterales bacterium]|nr:transporter [Solirubrobacterales bacterium]
MASSASRVIPAPPSASLSPALVRLLAIDCGATVAKLYYDQPLLDTIAHAIGVSSGTAGLIVTASQIGYAIGLVFVVPLGDLVHRRKLVCRLLLLTSLGLALTAAAPSIAILALGVCVVGTTSVVAQVLVPLASELAEEDDRGRVVGVVMSGLLIGILLARTVSGLIAEVGGWRLVYAVGAVLMLALTAALWRALPDTAPPSTLPYRGLLASVPKLIRREAVLRRRMAYGAMGMASFSALWTTLTFLLVREPYGYSDAVIGLFGLAGLVGAGSARFAGHLADGGREHAATGVFWLLVLAGWGFLALGTSSLAAIIVGIVLLDLGVQGQHILSQSMIYAAAPDARSRVTTAYMGSNFLWGAAGSAAGALAFSVGGWGAVCGLGGAFSMLAVVVWCVEHRRPVAVPG